MLIFGFKLPEDDDYWKDDPFSEFGTPESDICEACHVYHDLSGNRYIGFEVALGMPQSEMESLLHPFSHSLRIFRLV